MAVPVPMPRLGESVSEGTITRWLKKEGEQVEADEPLLEVSTDKVDTEIPSPIRGVVRSITVEEDETVDVGVVLCVIDDNHGTADRPDAEPRSSEPPQQAVPAVEEVRQLPPPASPHDRKGGATPPGGSAAATPQGKPSASAAVPTSVRGRTEPMSRLRKVIAERLTTSLTTSAQLTTVIEADVTRIATLRADIKADFEVREGTRLSFLPFFALAAVEALHEHPVVNARIDVQDGTITYHDAVHLSIAVDTDRGLLAPVIHNADGLGIAGLAKSISDLAQRARGNRLTPDELGVGTFTLTNTGSRGALFDTPIINQPHVAILGTGSVVKRPVVVQDPGLGEVVAVRSMVYLALTYDHRIVDGADAARYLTTVKKRLEEGDFTADIAR